VVPASEAYSKYNIRLMLAPRSAKARYSTEFARDQKTSRVSKLRWELVLKNC
ncbi:hypothetical protein Tco_0460085, partial [Tanacetum coccineum]